MDVIYLWTLKKCGSIVVNITSIIDHYFFSARSNIIPFENFTGMCARFVTLYVCVAKISKSSESLKCGFLFLKTKTAHANLTIFTPFLLSRKFRRFWNFLLMLFCLRNGHVCVFCSINKEDAHTRVHTTTKPPNTSVTS